MEKINSKESQSVSLVRGAGVEDSSNAEGYYIVTCLDNKGNIKWKEEIHNVVCTEGKNAALTHFLKGSSYTSAVRVGLIGNTTYSAPAAGNVASAINTSGSANSWNEATSSICATRGTPTFGTASAGALAFSSALSFSIIGTDTINGIFVLIKSAAGVDPTSTVANTSGAILSAGAFSSAKAVSNGDILNVSYTLTL
jgi:hypothetical protein